MDVVDSRPARYGRYRRYLCPGCQSRYASREYLRDDRDDAFLNIPDDMKTQMKDEILAQASKWIEGILQ